MQTTNFLPGMNPYLQARWPDAHTALIGYIREVLSERLPSDLAVIAEESISIDFDDGSDLRMRTDVAVIEQPSLRFPDVVPMQQDTSTVCKITKLDLCRAQFLNSIRTCNHLRSGRTFIRRL